MCVLVYNYSSLLNDYSPFRENSASPIKLKLLVPLAPHEIERHSPLLNIYCNVAFGAETATGEAQSFLLTRSPDAYHCEVDAAGLFALSRKSIAHLG